LYEHYFEEVFRFAWSRVKDRDLAGDLTSQTFSKALVALPKYKSQGVGLGAWLMRIALNQINMHFRKAKRDAEVPLTLDVADRLLEEVSSPVDDARRQRLIDGLNQLQEHEVALIELRYFEQRRFAEIGEILGISEDNAKVRTYRALGALKNAIFASDAQV
jgi:RNA polymerase sigma-70 factor (ECF subfamily)